MAGLLVAMDEPAVGRTRRSLRNDLQLIALVLGIATWDASVVFVMQIAAKPIAVDWLAVDYVLKPLSTARLSTTVGRLKKCIGSAPQRLDGLLERLAEPRDGGHLRWITAAQGREVRLITVGEVCYFRSDNKYTSVVTADGEALIRVPLRELIEQLDPAVFWQVHRHTVVNANAIAGLLRDANGHLCIKLRQRSETLPVSESHAARFRAM